MLNRCKGWNSHYVVIFGLFSIIPTILSILCYECQSTFPDDRICLPSCSQSEQVNSTCILTRDIPLAASGSGSIRASHIVNESVLLNAIEKNFLFGEEAVYESSSEIDNWDWQYGQITYGCDTSGCNDPKNVNRLPNALNAHIPDEILKKLLLGELKNTCQQCDICVDENNPNATISNCDTTSCPDYSCSFVATRNSFSSIEKCGNAWHFTSSCIRSQELAQVDMTLMYYISSNTLDVYQMEAICHSDNCNNFNTFIQLKDQITVDPDFSCFPTTTTSPSTIPTTSQSFADHIHMNHKTFLLVMSLFICHIINH